MILDQMASIPHIGADIRYRASPRFRDAFPDIGPDIGRRADIGTHPRAAVSSDLFFMIFHASLEKQFGHQTH